MNMRYVVVLYDGNKPQRILAYFDELAEADRFARQKRGRRGYRQGVELAQQTQAAVAMMRIRANLADFAKYGLTKRLAHDDFRLGVVWYPLRRERSRIMHYLSLPEPNGYSACDGSLYKALREVHFTRGDAGYLTYLLACSQTGRP